MKTIAIFLVGLFIVSQPAVMGQQSKKADKIARIAALVDSQTYVFNAQSATPLSGRLRQLTPGYTLTITPTHVASDLPYFGRAYSASLDPSQAGIKVSSDNFEYTKTPKKKGGWDIVIKPKDSRDVQQFLLTIYDDGYSSLQVISVNRQQISFNGYIGRPKQKN